MIQIIGRSGMLGLEVEKAAIEAGIPVETSYVDIVTVTPDDIKAKIVINCSGVASSTDKREQTIAVNQKGPKNLAKACDECGARLLHISTDAVFNRPGPHAENNYCDPQSLYGRSKMLGEVRSKPHLTVRTSFVGIGRRGIVSQLLNTNDVISASTKFLWNGHTAPFVATMLVLLAMRTDITGLIHIPGQFQTRYDLVKNIISTFDLDDSRVYIDDSYIADRRLISLRWRAIGLSYLPPFSEQLQELKKSYDNCKSTDDSTNNSSDTGRPKASSQAVAGPDDEQHMVADNTSERSTTDQ